MTKDLISKEAARPVKDSARWWALGVILIAQLIIVLDATIVTIALPEAAPDLNIAKEHEQWALTAYTLVFGGLLLLGGRLADYLGRRKMFLIGLIGFAVASALAGIAQNGAQFFAGRALQGAFAALLAPAALSLVSVTFTEPKERAKAFGAFAGISGAGAAIGLILGGALTDYANWRWTLLINTPIALLAFAGAIAFVVRDAPLPRKGGYDLPGAITGTAGLVAIVYGFSKAAEEGVGWTAPVTLSLFAAGVALLVAFVVIEAKVSNPLLPLHIPGEINRGGSFLIALIAPIAMFAMFLFLSFYFQGVLKYSAFEAGIAFLPFPIGIVISAGITSALLPKIGPRPLLLVGSAFGALGLFYLAQLQLGDSYWAVVFPATFVMALGMGPLFVSMQATALHQVEEKDSGVASALLNAANQIGGSIGTAMLTTIAVNAAKDYGKSHAPAPDLAARAQIYSYDVGFYWGAGFFIVAGIIAALMIRDKPQNLIEGPVHDEELDADLQSLSADTVRART